MMTDTSHRKRAWKWILGIFAALFALLAVELAGGAWWLWGWKLGELRFHESWSPEQRAELQTLAHHILHFRQDYQASPEMEAQRLVERLNAALQKGSSALLQAHNATQPSKLESLLLDIKLRGMLAPAYQALRHLASTGKASKNKGISVAQIACRMQMLELAKEIIRRGEDPNAGFDQEEETAFQSALLCQSYFDYDYQIPSVEERLSLLTVMLEHGAKVNLRTAAPYPRNTCIISAIISAQSDPPDHGAVIEWLFDHGLKVSTPSDERDAACLAGLEGVLPTLQRLVQQGHLPNTERMKTLLLHNAVTSTAADTPEQTRWLLEELKADPTRAIEPEDADEPAPTSTSSVLDMISSGSSYDPAGFRIHLQTLDLLLQHGAQLPENLALPRSRALRQEFNAFLKEHGREPHPEAVISDMLLEVLQRYNILDDEVEEENEDE